MVRAPCAFRAPSAAPVIKSVQTAETVAFVMTAGLDPANAHASSATGASSAIVPARTAPRTRAAVMACVITAPDSAPAMQSSERRDFGQDRCARSAWPSTSRRIATSRVLRLTAFATTAAPASTASAATAIRLPATQRATFAARGARSFDLSSHSDRNREHSVHETLIIKQHCFLIDHSPSCQRSDISCITFTSDCGAGYWGQGCINECPGGAANPCSGHGVCNPHDGKCICTAGSGYGGWNCGDKCPVGELTPGSGVLLVCTARGTCSDEKCVCRPGYWGAACQGTCPGGSGAAACNGVGECSGETGKCVCESGYAGLGI